MLVFRCHEMGLWSTRSRSLPTHPLFARATESKQLTTCKARAKPALNHLQLLWLNQIFFKLTTMSTKLSICFIYHGLFQRANSRLVRATRMVTNGTILLIVGYYVPAFFVSIFQCTPVSKSWHSKEPGTCINLDEFRFYTAAANIVTSVLVITTPLPALSKMRHTRPEVTQLMGLILLGMV